MSLHETLKKIYDRVTRIPFVEVMSDQGWQRVESLNRGRG